MQARARLQRPTTPPQGVAVALPHSGRVHLDMVAPSFYVATDTLTQEKKPLPEGTWEVVFDDKGRVAFVSSDSSFKLADDLFGSEAPSGRAGHRLLELGGGRPARRVCALGRVHVQAQSGAGLLEIGRGLGNGVDDGMGLPTTASGRNADFLVGVAAL